MRPSLLAPLLWLVPALVRADPVPAESAASTEPPPDGARTEAPAAEESATDDDLAETGEEPASADADSAHDRGSTFRWSDGPRRVPEPHGRSAERAAELGLGTRECASRLLHGEPDEAWTGAARGREPSRLLWPVDEGGWVRGFGYVRTTRPDLIHRGIDIAAPEGTVVRAAADGIVAYADNGVHGYGNLVMIVHRNGWMTLYAHNSRVTVQAGYRVTRGERIALVGSTGIAHGPHVHFELWRDGHAVDPAALFDGGPAFVARIGERAAARGEVPPVGEVTAEDRRVEAALAPHPSDGGTGAGTGIGTGIGAGTGAGSGTGSGTGIGTGIRTGDGTGAGSGAGAGAGSGSGSGAGTGSGAGIGTATGTATGGERGIGSVELARWLLAHPAPEGVIDSVEGRVFSTLLFPVRGGEVRRAHRSSRRPMEIRGDEGTAIRAAADGLVVFVGTLTGVGDTVVLLHENGWATFYERVDLSRSPAAGTGVERGAWIAHATDEAVRFELRVGGVVRDPADVIVDPRSRDGDERDPGDGSAGPRDADELP